MKPETFEFAGKEFRFDELTEEQHFLFEQLVHIEKVGQNIVDRLKKDMGIEDA
jgi:hypothetical protein